VTAAILLSALAGLLAGPVVDQVAYRGVRRQPFDLPSCRSCGRSKAPLAWWSACRACGRPVPGRTLAVSGLTAAAVAGTVWVIGSSWLLPAYLVFALATSALVVTDLEEKLIPNRILYPATVVFALLLAGGAGAEDRIADLGRAALGGAGYFTVFLLVALVARGGFGLGDVKLAALLGMATAFSSWRVLGAAAAFTALLGGIPAIVLLVTRRASRGTELPYGPAMIFGAWLALAFGEAAARWYLG
jgi:leader peptidase (prepilin peptidase) / N-methyltransferase